MVGIQKTFGRTHARTHGRTERTNSIVPVENFFFGGDKNIKNLDINKKLRWGLSKDDVSPQDIFRMTNEGPKERYLIAKYCIQDCVLCVNLMNKLNVLTNNIGMANVCSVPLSYLFMRGQGIKIFSLVTKQCRKENFCIPYAEKQFDDSGYVTINDFDPIPEIPELSFGSFWFVLVYLLFRSFFRSFKKSTPEK